MNNRKIDQKNTKQVVIDKGYHQLLKEAATGAQTSIKDFLEGILSTYFIVEDNRK